VALSTLPTMVHGLKHLYIDIAKFWKLFDYAIYIEKQKQKQKKPSMYKFIQLLSSNNIRELCNLGFFLSRSFKLRDDLIVSA
jgi:hypothetical protein